VSEAHLVNAVELNNVSVRFGARWALVRLSAAFPANKTILLTGANGAGKTTLMRTLATAMKPTRGSLKVLGLDAETEVSEIRRRMTLVTHGSHLYDDLTARQNLQLVTELTGAGTDSVAPLLERVGLTEQADRAVAQFSAGMKRRVVIARMLLRRPDLVLLDEPFGQLDVGGVELMTQIIAELGERGATVIVATHNHELGRSVSDLHMDLADGRIVHAPIEIAA
jgi:heme exporter protein A